MDIRKKLKKHENKRLIAIVCMDEGKFRLRYYFDNNKGKVSAEEFTLMKKKPNISSIIEMFPTADLYEREIHDFFGVEFEGNPHLHTTLFLPEEEKHFHPHLKKGAKK